MPDTLTSKQILEALTASPTSVKARGAALYLAMQQRTGRIATTRAQRDLIEALGKRARHRPERRVIEVPNGAGARDPRDLLNPGEAKERKLEPVSPLVAGWVGALPADPSKITFEDAQRLGHIARHTDRLTLDGAIVHQRWDAVRHHWEAQAAQANLDNVKVAKPAPELPAQALGAVTEALMAELGISENEARAVARERIDEAVARRDADYDRQLVRAQAAHEAAVQAVADDPIPSVA
jgi:hypothetical protein